MPPGFPGETSACTASGMVFAISNSHTLIKTYRAGWLKNLAHNHVITTDSVRGFAYRDEAQERSYAELYFRPIDLELDDPEVRAAAGPGFEATRSPADIAATRVRMLGPRLLDSNGHPFVRVRVAPVVRPGENALSAALRISFRGGEHQLVVPMKWFLDGDRLVVESSFEITHEALGIRPYSAFAYAIGVDDTIDVAVRLEADRVICPG